jgi:hypothetical protein
MAAVAIRNGWWMPKGLSAPSGGWDTAKPGLMRKYCNGGSMTSSASRQWCVRVVLVGMHIIIDAGIGLRCFFSLSHLPSSENSQFVRGEANR